MNLVSLRAFTVATALMAIVATPTAQSGLPAVASPPSLARESDASFGEPRPSASRGGGAKAGPTQDQRLDSIAGAGVRENRAVGIVAAVVEGNDTLLLKGYGKADVECDVPMTVDAMFQIGSDTKQFTAAAILQLRDEGKLSLDDDITKWLPDFDTRGNKVTLRHLLDHTSGIVDLARCRSFARCAHEEPHGHSRRRLRGHQSLSVPVPDGDAADLQQLRLLAPRPHHREGERDDLRGLRREEDLRAAGHDALDVLQQLGERPAPRLRVRHEERHQPSADRRSCTRRPSPPARSARRRRT